MPDFRDPEVLAWVNGLRERLDLGDPLDVLPDGRAWSGYRCPIARALGVADPVRAAASVRGPVFYVGRTYVYVTVRDPGRFPQQIPMPYAVIRWVEEFDGARR